MPRTLATLLALLLLVATTVACGDSSDDRDASPPAASAGAPDPGAGAGGSDHGGAGHGGAHHAAAGDGAPQQMAGEMQVLAGAERDEMRVEIVAMAPETFTVVEGASMIEHRPADDDGAHLMVTLTDAATRERIPYASVQLALSREGRRVVDTRLWPMISRHVGTHYGENVALPEPGRYDAVVTVGAPAVARHPELADKWTRPMKLRFALNWDPQR